MKKKLILAAVSALSVLTLAACSGSSSNEIATMKGGKITVEESYPPIDRLKSLRSKIWG